LVKLGELMSFMTSGSRGWAEHYSEKGALFLRVQNVGANSLLLDDVAYVNPPDSAESRRTRVRSGDLLISATADIGRTGVIPENFHEAYINQHLFLIRLNSFNPVFVAGYFSTPSGKAQILQLDREGVKSGLNFDDAKGLSIFNIPLAEQDSFASVHKQYGRLHYQQNESIRQVEYLYQSLLQRAFQGEL
jgi:type I restriction enzyme, S subunit